MPSVDIFPIFSSLPGHHLLLRADEPFTILAASPSYAGIYSTTPQKLEGSSFTLANTSNTEESLDAIQEALRTKTRSTRKLNIPNGSWLASYSPIAESNGTIAYILLSLTAAAQGSEETQGRLQTWEYRDLFDAMDQGFCIMEMIFDENHKAQDYRFLEVNPVFEKQSGIKNAVGRTARELVPGLEEQWFERYGLVVSSGEPVRFTQGSKALGRWFDIYAYPIGARTDNKLALIFTDITEQETNRRKAEESEQQVRALVESAPFPIGVYIGREMRIAFVNQSIIEVWGKGSDLIGKTYSEVLPELDNQQIYAQLDDVYTTGIPYHAKNRRVDLVMDGKLQSFYFNYSFTPLFDADGKVYGVMNTAADVTDLNVALQQVKQSEANFRRMIVQAPVAMCIMIGPEHVVDIANDAMIQLWGKNRAAVMGKPIFEALPDAREQGLEKLLDQVYETGEAFSGMERPVELLRQGKMELTYQNFVYQPYRNADGVILGVLAISVEVTEQVVARKKIEDAEQRARLAIESADLGTYEVYLKTNEVIASPRFQAIWQVHDLSDRNPYAKMIHPDDQLQRERALSEAYHSGHLHYEARILPEDNKLKWVRVRGMVLKDEQQQPDRILGVVQDITEQKQFAEELRKQVEEQTAELLQAHATLLNTNRYFQHIINKFESALVSLIPVFEEGEVIDFRFKMANDAYSAYSQLSPQAIQNKRVSEVFPGYYKTDAFQRYREVYLTGQPQNWELHYNQDGLDIFLVISVSKMNDEVIVNFTDFTELKNLQLDLEHKIEELQRLNQNLEEFAYAASHDLKEPIRKILVFSSRLKDSLGKTFNAAEQGYFERIETASRRMGTLIDDLLAYSEAGHKPGLQEAVDLNQLIEQVLADLDLEIEQKKAVIEVEKLFTMRGYPRQLQQAFQNLIGNALKYSKPDEAPHIRIRCEVVRGEEAEFLLTAEERPKEFYRLTIRDNGIGFEQSDAERIFNIFTRLHGMAEYKGTGVGLSIVQKVIQNHQGYIRAQSSPGEGAAFIVLLPKNV